MKIGVVSDTHGKPECFRMALKQMGNIDMLIHAGDHYQDAIDMNRESGIKTVAVTGNCDSSIPGADEVVLELEGYRILITHGHKYGVKSGSETLAKKLKQENYDLIIYGHSHVAELTRLPGGYLFNPGSVASPRRGSSRSYGIVEIGNNGIVPYIHELKW